MKGASVNHQINTINRLRLKGYVRTWGGDDYSSRQTPTEQRTYKKPLKPYYEQWRLFYFAHMYVTFNANDFYGLNRIKYKRSLNEP